MLDTNSQQNVAIETSHVHTFSAETPMIPPYPQTGSCESSFDIRAYMGDQLVYSLQFCS